MVENDKEKQEQAMALMDEKEEAKAATKAPKASKKKTEGGEEGAAPESLFDAPASEEASADEAPAAE